MPRTFTQLYYHLVFATKLRLPWIDARIQPELYAFCGGVLQRQAGLLLSIGGMPDHVHLLVSLRANSALSKVVRHLKGSSSKWISQNFELENPFAWQEGYAAFTVSHSAVPQVRRYIERQEEHHRNLSLSDELEELCRRHGIADPPRS